MRGRPAATRLPKATTKMTIVTGQDSISERNMALRLTALKSAQRALAPVRVTEMPGLTVGEGDQRACQRQPPWRWHRRWRRR